MMHKPFADKYKILLAILLLVSFGTYSAFIYINLPQKNSTYNLAASSGKMTWQKYNCTACHQLYGLGGYLGPDLTNVYSKRGPDYIRAFLINGTNVMPNFHLTDKEMTDLTEYLKCVDSTGTSDLRTFKIKNNGNIEQ